MTVADEITRIKTNISDTYTVLENKGAQLPVYQNSDNLAQTAETITITSGGGSGDFITNPINRVSRIVHTLDDIQITNEVTNYDIK